jgi:predicted DNA-binding transcriptional regulator YafY
VVYRPTARVLTVLELLQAQGRMTGAALATRLEVDIRTVRHYVEMLRDLGIPVVAERGRHGAYQLRPGYKLPPLIFTEDESLALTLSLIAARQSGLASTAPAVAGALAKIERVLPEATRARIQAVERTVVFGQRIAEAPPPTLAVTTLSAAVQAGRSVRLSYRAGDTGATERTFDPYGVVAHHGAWYTIGYCHLRQDQRTFRLDRIVQIEPTEAHFARPEDFDALATVRQSIASIPNTWQLEVWLSTTAAHAQLLTSLPPTSFTAADDGVMLRSEIADLHAAAQDLASLGVRFVIHNPPELRTHLRRYALDLARDAAREPQGAPP